MSKITKTQIGVLIFSILYVIAFAVYYIVNTNYEFMLHVSILVLAIILISILHYKFRFSTGILVGISIWGLLHMLGGSLKIGGTRLYSIILLNIVPSQNILKFDQFLHMYCYIIVTLMAFFLLKPNLSKKMHWATISVLLIFVGMGMGALNEIIEFAAVLSMVETGIGGYENTLWDMVFNTFGALIAVIYINIRKNKSKHYSLG